MPSITPCLWFDTEGEEAAQLYTSVFPDSRITHVERYGPAGPRPEGTVIVVAFELDGQPFVALNGGPQYRVTEAVSFQVDCATQEEVDPLLERALRGRRGGPLAG
jgi:predicted 3-demethylubiquinone-9 3-methyltransferase (glyoxalase superfamily)